LLTLEDLAAKPDASQRQRNLLWAAVLDRFGQLKVPPQSAKASDGVQASQYLPRIGSGPHLARSIRVNLVPKGTSQERTIYSHEVRALLAQAMPGKISVAGGVRVWIINPLDDPTMSLAAAQILDSPFVGDDLVMLTDTAGTPQQNGVPEKTTYLYVGDTGLEAAKALQDVMATGQVAEERSPVQDIDLTVILGRDFEARVLRDRAAAQQKNSDATASSVAPRDANRPQDNAPVEGTKKKKKSGNG
jgi:hypothetical protein